jgi:predicted enzyme related to lactoylglutathione lyase
MSVTTVAHVNLRGNARAALEFYQSVFGGRLASVTYADARNVQNPDEADQVMWGQVTSPPGLPSTACSPTRSASPGYSTSPPSTTVTDGQCAARPGDRPRL